MIAQIPTTMIRVRHDISHTPQALAYPAGIGTIKSIGTLSVHTTTWTIIASKVTLRELSKQIMWQYLFLLVITCCSHVMLNSLKHYSMIALSNKLAVSMICFIIKHR